MLVTTHNKDRAIRLWNVKTGEQLQEFSYQAPKGRPFTDVYFALFTPDAKRVVVGAKADLYLFDRADGSRVFGFRRYLWNTFRGALTPDGKRSVDLFRR